MAKKVEITIEEKLRALFDLQLIDSRIDEIRNIIGKYKNAEDVVWAQEEPRNMGAYSHMMMHLDEARTWRAASRRPYGAPAAGSSVRSKTRHQEVIDYVFDKSKNCGSNRPRMVLKILMIIARAS